MKYCRSRVFWPDPCFSHWVHIKVLVVVVMMIMTMMAVTMVVMLMMMGQDRDTGRDLFWNDDGPLVTALAHYNSTPTPHHTLRRTALYCTACTMPKKLPQADAMSVRMCTVRVYVRAPRKDF